MSNPKFEEYKKKEADKIAALKTKYPILLQKIDYFSCDIGWHSLLDNLCSIISHHVEHLPMEIKGEMYVVQIKEKFGGLHFYMEQSTPFIDGAIRMAEYMSYSICEVCGLPGMCRKGGWIKTLCDHHHEENQKDKNKRG